MLRMESASSLLYKEVMSGMFQVLVEGLIRLATQDVGSMFDGFLG